MNEDIEQEGRGPRLMLTLVIIAVIAAAVILVIDYRLKAQIVAEANKLRAAGHGTQQQPGARREQAAPRHPVPTVQPRVHPVDGVGDAAGSPEDGDLHEAAPIVRPGDESARPPRRGGVNVPGTGDGL